MQDVSSWPEAIYVSVFSFHGIDVHVASGRVEAALHSVSYVEVALEMK